MKKLILLFIAIFTFGSCDSGFEDINVNPTKPTQLSPATKLTYIQLYTGGSNYVATLFYDIAHLMSNVQQLNTTTYNNSFSYQVNRTNDFFDEQFPTNVKNVVDLVAQLETSTSSTAAADLAIANIQKVLIFSRLTDTYGDIPYSEAGKGFLEGIRYPKYDPQSEIYMDMLSLLENSSTVLSNPANLNSYGNADLFFAGNNAKWKKFANSLMLRLALRMVKVDETNAKAWATKAIAGGVMTSNSDIAFIKYENNSNDGGPNVNPFTKSLSSRGTNQIKISKTFLDYLIAKNDPRISVLCSTSTGVTTASLQVGQDINVFTSTSANSKPNINIFGGSGKLIYDAPFFFQTYAEVEFMLAEASFRWGLGDGDTAGHYDKGVRAAMSYLAMYGTAGTISTTAIDNYLTANPFDSSKALQMINEQYWVATFGNGVESFSNWKRTGFPQLVPMNIASTLTGGQIPRRFVYTSTEKLNNPDNVQAAIERQGGDDVTTRMWWDK